MPILRHRHERDFTVISNGAIRDPALSLRAVGLLVYMLSLPDDWRFSIAGLAKTLSLDGKAAISASIVELEQAGYLERSQQRGGRGRMGDAIWTISDVKLTVNRFSADGETADGETVTNKESNNQESIIQEPINRESRESVTRSSGFVPPTREEIADYCRQSGISLDVGRFFDYYTSNGWRVRRNPMRDWRASVRSWNSREKDFGNGKDTAADPHLERWKNLPGQVIL